MTNNDKRKPMFTFAAHLDVEAHGLPLQDAHQLRGFFQKKIISTTINKWQ
jgi:hypothetical protein